MQFLTIREMNAKLSLASVYILMRDRISLYSTYVIHYVPVISSFIFAFNIIKYRKEEVIVMNMIDMSLLIHHLL